MIVCLFQRRREICWRPNWRCWLEWVADERSEDRPGAGHQGRPGEGCQEGAREPGPVGGGRVQPPRLLNKLLNCLARHELNQWIHIYKKNTSDVKICASLSRVRWTQRSTRSASTSTSTAGKRNRKVMTELVSYLMAKKSGCLGAQHNFGGFSFIVRYLEFSSRFSTKRSILYISICIHWGNSN